MHRSIETTVTEDLASTEHELREALARQGFGVLTEVDVAATLRAKLGVERPPLKILGVCNPTLADRALALDSSVALLLPCNVVLEPVGAGTGVRIIDPRDLIDDSRFAELADEAAARLRAAVDQLGQRSTVTTHVSRTHVSGRPPSRRSVASTTVRPARSSAPVPTTTPSHQPLAAPNHRQPPAATPPGPGPSTMAPLSSLLPIADGPVTAVVAHPDDESFGLGALLAGLDAEGREVRVLCLTRGEASTIGANAELGAIRRQELSDAAAVLGVALVTLFDLPDGALDAVPDTELDMRIDSWLDDETTALIVLEPQGVTGHPDHQAASRAAERVADRRALPVIEWGIDPVTASRLHDQHGLSFRVIGDGPGVFDVAVDRTAQLAAIRCHLSQLDDDPVVFKRLAVQGNFERVHIRPPHSPTPEQA